MCKKVMKSLNLLQGLNVESMKDNSINCVAYAMKQIQIGTKRAKVLGETGIDNNSPKLRTRKYIIHGISVPFPENRICYSATEA